jgi:plasmid stabilization system protein ParE
VTVRLTPEAEADLTEAFAWYRERGAELGTDFLHSFDRTLDSLATHPESFPVVHRDLRRALMRRFPYCVFYTLDVDGPVVLACFHARRDPTAWRRRAGA